MLEGSVLAECLWIPEDQFTEQMEEALTVTIHPLIGDPFVVEGWRSDVKGKIGLPRQFGLKLVSNYVDQTSRGKKAAFPRLPSLREEQEPFVESMLEASACHNDFIARAATGKGKTVCALLVIAERNRTAVVVVDQENLMEQWIERAEEHLGLHRDDIGIVQGPKSAWKGKSLVICMMQTIINKEMPDEFYDYFGTAVFDESHTAGAPTFSRAMMMFSAEVRFGVSATPKRRDALGKLIEWNLGIIRAELDSKPETSLLYIVENESVYSWQANAAKVTGRYLSEIAEDGARNLKIAKAAQWLYDSGRDVLVISDRVEHLSALMALCVAIGVPAEDMGLYAKSEVKLIYEKDPTPARVPTGLQKGAEYTPIRLAPVQKTIKKDRLKRVLAEAKIIFATYGIMAKGVDCPRLSGGIDATPRSEATQVVGRILRIMDSKLIPIWVTIADVNSYRSLYQLTSRLTDYVASNAEVYLWQMGKGRRALDTKALVRVVRRRTQDLRAARIITSLDGSYTLPIPTLRLANENIAAKTTERTTRPKSRR